MAWPSTATAMFCRPGTAAPSSAGCICAALCLWSHAHLPGRQPRLSSAHPPVVLLASQKRAGRAGYRLSALSVMVGPRCTGHTWSCGHLKAVKGWPGERRNRQGTRRHSACVWLPRLMCGMIVACRGVCGGGRRWAGKTSWLGLA
jgi:hypothetical protein